MERKKFSVITIIAATFLLVWAMPIFAAEMQKVNINTASKELLMTLDGVGEAYADRIIKYRETNGFFQSPGDIQKVKGIGKKTYEMNKNRIVTKDE